MGASCSHPTAIAAAPAQPAQEILVLVSGHSGAEMRMLKRMLSRNSRILKERIEEYEEKLKVADETNPATTVWRAEKERAEDLLKNLLRMQLPLAYMS